MSLACFEVLQSERINQHRDQRTEHKRLLNVKSLSKTMYLLGVELHELGTPRTADALLVIAQAQVLGLFCALAHAVLGVEVFGLCGDAVLLIQLLGCGLGATKEVQEALADAILACTDSVRL